MHLYFLPLDNDLAWPYSVRISTRAKRAKLSVTSNGKTELILPFQKQAPTHAQIEKIILPMRPWFCKTINKLFQASAQKEAIEQLIKQQDNSLELKDILPKHIELALLGEVWQLSIHHPPEHSKENILQLEELNENDKQLLLTCSQNYKKECCKLLLHWLKHKAKPILEQQTREFAQDMGLSVTRVSIGAQKARWGSCSSKGNINLNCRLLLLPPYLAKHVILHEICHLAHLNHSQAFRNLLASVEPWWKQYEKELNHAWSTLPFWAV